MGLDWPNAQAALRAGKKVRRGLWVTWIFKDGAKMLFDLPQSWKDGRVYWPTDTDRAAEDWETL